MRFSARLFTGFAAVCLLVSTSESQTPSGSVSGTVSDNSGAQVAGATVRITNKQTHETHSATTSGSGTYVFPSVQTGDYILEAESAGFKREQRTGVTLDVNQNARVDFLLQIGAVSEVVKVSGDAPLVDTREVQLGETVDRQRIENLPLNGRNVYDLIGLMPGVTTVNTSVTGTNDGNNMSVNGNRIRDNNFYLDGAPNTQQFRNGGNMSPNPDAVEEFHLITSNFDAEYGRQPGSVLNVVTRSGSNGYHGAAFEFLRNDTTNARNFFQASVTPLHWNQYGGTLGGPIRKDRTFFFASYQGFRESTNSFVNGITLPTVAQRSGDFSALSAAKRPIDPLTGQAFPGGIIPASRLDPVVQNILKMMVPLPNDPSGTTFSASVPAPVQDDQGMLRMDHQLTASNRLSGTLFFDRSVTVLPFDGTASNIPKWANTSTTYSQNNAILSDDWILSPTLIGQARFSYTNSNYNQVTTNNTSWSDFGSQIALGATPPRPPQITVTGAWTAGTYGNDLMPQTTYSASEKISWVYGSHSVRAGVTGQYNHFREYGNWLGAGQITFSGAFTGNAEADFLIGMAATFRQNSGLNRDFKELSWAAFAQDDWKVLPRLTLNLGLRWELNPPYTSAGNQLGGFQFGVQSKVYPTAPTGLLFPGDPGVPAGIAPTIYTNFAPRVGLAYDVFGNGKTAIRAGYGFFYAVGMVNLVSNLQNQPFIVDITLNGTKNLVNPWGSLGMTSPFPYTLSAAHPVFVTPITANYVGENSGTPYVQQYNFTVQQQIGSNMSLQVAYVGNTARKLYVARDANTPIYSATATAANINARRPYMPGVFGGIYEDETAANANYNALQLTFTRRFSRGISLAANYSFSKSIDIVDDEATSISNVALESSNNFALNRGPSGFNTPQVFHMSWIYQESALQRFGWVGREVLGGWQLNGITVARSGQSFNVLSGTDSNLDGVSTDRPNLVGNVAIDGDRSRPQMIAQWFNTAAFAKVPAGTLYGTAGRDILFGPPSVTWNAAAMKDFRIKEGMRLQLRTDFFNIFNQVNLGNPNGTLSSASFGKITSAAAPRLLQFGLKFYY